MQTLLLPCSNLASSSPPPRLIFHLDSPRVDSRYPVPATSFCYSHRPKLAPLKNSTARRTSGCIFHEQGDAFDGFSIKQLSQNLERDRVVEGEALELRNKPALVAPEGCPAEEGGGEKDDVLAPFLKFFKGRNSLEGDEKEKEDDGDGVEELVRDKNGSEVSREENVGRIDVEYYEPKAGDFVVGVVVSGNENRLDVNVGADLLGTMLKKEMLPLYDEEKEYLLFDFKDEGGHRLGRGKLGIVKYDEAIPDKIALREVLSRRINI